MEIQEVITKAVEGGWKKVCANCQESWAGHVQTRIGSRYCMRTPKMSDTVLDPLFFQALGKAMGWNMTDSFDAKDQPIRQLSKAHVQDRYMQSWHFFENTPVLHQHRLISHLQDGGSIESFFETL